MAVIDDIRGFVNSELLDGAEPGSGDPLQEGKLDSLAIEQIIGFCESQYDVTFEDDDLIAENFSSLEAIARLVESKQADGAPSEPASSPHST